MLEKTSNKAGMVTAGFGVVGIIVTVFVGIRGGFHLFETPYLIALGASVGVIVLGLFVRLVGYLLAAVGVIGGVAGLLHAFLNYWMEVAVLPLPTEISRAGVVTFKGYALWMVYVAFVGGSCVLAVIGFLLARTRSEEEADAAKATARGRYAYNNRLIRCARCEWRGIQATFDQNDGCPSCANQTYHVVH